MSIPFLSDQNYDLKSAKVSFIGNGYIGMDVVKDRQILLALNDSKGFTISTSFYPLVELEMNSVAKQSAHVLSDFNEGNSKAIFCTVVENKCVCANHQIYMHRTRPNVLVQEIRFSNPSGSALDFTFSHSQPSGWDKQESGSAPVYLRTFDENARVMVAIMCSSVPSMQFTVKPRREEVFRFSCVLQHEIMLPTSDVSSTKLRLARMVRQQFSDLNGLLANDLDKEHKDAWRKLNEAAFNISFSKAPNALNADMVNLTKYALLSNVRAPLVEVGTEAATRAIYETRLEKTELCYSGHSTMLTPSKLWQSWGSLRDLLKTIEIWLMTLEHRGCMNLVHAGAHGVAEAFLLSLTAATFTHHRLEITLDPADLHRHIRVENLRIGQTKLSLMFDLDSSYRTNVKLWSTGSPLYACSAGCVESPSSIGGSPVQLAIKITKPPTPILFISTEKLKLEQLKDTLHVIGVEDAPAHDSETIALHKHGQNTGLPTIFWVVLIFMLVAFHLFLFKLIYSEWKNSSNIPYTKLTKKMLLKRNSDFRDH
uniref:Uncharacterized protein n=1 Tax=Acrobeloides nanus TaxID=290746 RepID=A0A914BWI6_9BILA